MRYSIQQIKFEFISAIREIDDDAARWDVASSDCPPDEALRLMGHDPDAFVFMAKPAMSSRAADLVMAYMVDRLGVRPDDFSTIGHWALLYRRREDAPSGAGALAAPR